MGRVAGDVSYYLPDRFDELLCECWCAEELVHVKRAELGSGLTKACKRRRCRDLDTQERARVRVGRARGVA